MKISSQFFILLLISLIFVSKSYASTKVIPTNFPSGNMMYVLQLHDTILLSPDSIQVLKIPAPEGHKNKKLISAILAFPFPFGFMGAHRVMLGCKPWVPVFYVATFGGCFGLLPMIDFCAILLSKDIGQYENNPNVFMWVK